MGLYAEGESGGLPGFRRSTNLALFHIGGNLPVLKAALYNPPKPVAQSSHGADPSAPGPAIWARCRLFGPHAFNRPGELLHTYPGGVHHALLPRQLGVPRLVQISLSSDWGGGGGNRAVVTSRSNRGSRLSRTGGAHGPSLTDTILYGRPQGFSFSVSRNSPYIRSFARAMALRKLRLAAENAVRSLCSCFPAIRRGSRRRAFVYWRLALRLIALRFAISSDHQYTASGLYQAHPGEAWPRRTLPASRLAAR